MARVESRSIRGPQDVVEHFDAEAGHYHDTHGRAECLLAYRLGVIRGLLAAAPRGTLLEIGCGTGIHLLPLAGDFRRAIGIDISPQMVRVARDNAERSPWRDRISVAVDSAELLATVDDQSVDAALCVGVLEHVLGRGEMARQVRRVLSPPGAFVCLTPNGRYVWYTHVAPLLGVETRHLSTDRFLTSRELTALLDDAGLSIQNLRYWRFVPKGDMPAPLGTALSALDRAGRLLGSPYLRGGIAVAANRAAA